MKLLTKKIEVVDHVATGAQARAARVKSRKTAAFVAAHLGFSGPYISHLERGRSNWTEELLRRFERAL